MRARYPDHLDLRYGPRERNRIDFLKAHEKCPTLLFIHGGYWQQRAKEVFTLFAAGPMAHGINVALIGYTLEPIRHSYLNVKLGLDEAMSRRNSPVMQAGGAMKPLSLVVGGGELPLLRKQTADFAGHRARFGLPVTYEEIPGADHFTIMNELVSPAGRITTLIRQLFEWTA
jgi:acetyl esterase/lipase